MPPRSRRLLSERSGASAGSLGGAPRLPPLALALALAFALAFPAADIAGARPGLARDRRARACGTAGGLAAFWSGGDGVVFAGFEMDAGCGGVGRGRTTTQEAVGPANKEKWAGPIQFGFTSWAATYLG
jgi:hypothetical protein